MQTKRHHSISTWRSIGLLLVIGLILPVHAQTNRLTIMSHDSFDISKEVISIFEKQNGVTLHILKSGDAGAALNKAILSKASPMADVFYGVDNTFYSRALDADIFLPNKSQMESQLHKHLMRDTENRLWPVAYGDVCLNYDKKWFKEKKLSPPTSLDDILKYQYRGLTVVQNPATSSTGLAFLLITISNYGDNGYLSFWQKLKSNGALIVDGWENAYWGKFSAASDGNYPIVVSYGTSPSAEVHFSKTPVSESPTGAVISPKSAFRQIEYAGILKGTRNPSGAAKLIDFMLSSSFQEEIPLKMFMYPSIRTAKLPDVFQKYSKEATEPSTLPPEVIAMNRDKWIQTWTRTILR